MTNVGDVEPLSKTRRSAPTLDPVTNRRDKRASLSVIVAVADALEAMTTPAVGCRVTVTVLDPSTTELFSTFTLITAVAAPAANVTDPERAWKSVPATALPLTM